jgi:hypothetical protein
MNKSDVLTRDQSPLWRDEGDTVNPATDPQPLMKAGKLVMLVPALNRPVMAGAAIGQITEVHKMTAKVDWLAYPDGMDAARNVMKRILVPLPACADDRFAKQLRARENVKHDLVWLNAIEVALQVATIYPLIHGTMATTDDLIAETLKQFQRANNLHDRLQATKAALSFAQTLNQILWMENKAEEMPVWAN